jgi:hypothetical protein
VGITTDGNHVESTIEDRLADMIRVLGVLKWMVATMIVLNGAVLLKLLW